MCGLPWTNKRIYRNWGKKPVTEPASRKRTPSQWAVLLRQNPPETVAFPDAGQWIQTWPKSSSSCTASWPWTWPCRRCLSCWRTPCTSAGGGPRHTIKPTDEEENKTCSLIPNQGQAWVNGTSRRMPNCTGKDPLREAHKSRMKEYNYQKSFSNEHHWINTF